MFEAPGPNDPLPVPSSAWHQGSLVRLPLEHWTLILNFARALDPLLCARLEDAGAGAGELDEVDGDPTDWRAIARFAASVRIALENAPPLVPEATDDVPDELVNAEHARMLEAFEGILAVSIRRGARFRAWLD